MFVDLMHNPQHVRRHFLKVQWYARALGDRAVAGDPVATRGRRRTNPGLPVHPATCEEVQRPRHPRGCSRAPVAGRKRCLVRRRRWGRHRTTESTFDRTGRDAKGPDDRGGRKLRSLEPRGHGWDVPALRGRDRQDAWANVGRNDPCPCGSGKSTSTRRPRRGLTERQRRLMSLQLTQRRTPLRDQRR